MKTHNWYKYMSIKNIVIAVTAAITISGIGAINNKGMCGIVRDDGSICQKLTGGEKDCKELGGKWDSKKNCCEIQNI